HYATPYDTTPFIRESVDEVFHTLIESVVLVAGVILLFLQDWKALLLPVIDMAVSLVGTFVVMKLIGFTLNTLTLFGRVLAIGIGAGGLDLRRPQAGRARRPGERSPAVVVLCPPGRAGGRVAAGASAGATTRHARRRAGRVGRRPPRPQGLPADVGRQPRPLPPRRGRGRGAGLVH